MLRLRTGTLSAAVDHWMREQSGNGLPDIDAAAVLHGNGNVIAIVELGAARERPLPVLRHATTALCENVSSVRIDGVLFFQPHHDRGRRMVFFDRDGTWEAMCGNGLRCLTRYAADRGLIGASGVIVTDDGPKAVRVDGDLVEVTLGPAREVQQIDETRWFVYNGVAHLVVFLDGIDELARVDVPTEGARLRHDTELCHRVGHPEGVHVDFVAVDGDQLRVRTYEVGVEDETLCCGTGIAAAAYLGWHTGRNALPVELRTQGGVVRADLSDGQLRIAGAVGYLLRPQVGERPLVRVIDDGADT